MNVTVSDGKGGKWILPYRGEESFLRLFAVHGIAFSAPCGGNGVCGKCKITLLEGSAVGVTVGEEFSACRSVPLQDCTVLVGAEKGNGLDSYEFPRRAVPRGEGLGVALDLGTTTLAASLVRLSDGAVLGKRSCLNPQAVFGSDVISRIRACAEHKNIKRLADSVHAAVRGLIGELLLPYGEKRVACMTVAGNTTMLHLFCAIDPTPLGVAPFEPVFTQRKSLRGEDYGLPAEEVTLLPSVSAFVGADITADILAADLRNCTEHTLLVDLGTNGEIVLKAHGKLYCTSTAAGPALEGACIECGTGGVVGAINRVWEESGRLVFETVSHAPPAGICGSGLVDLVACLLDRGEIDETGYLDSERYYLTETVYLTRADVRQFQLAKAAVSAGIATLLSHAEISEGEISRCLIAGGLGSFIDVHNAVRTGLLPAALERNSRAVGNGSLYGAQLALLDENCLAEASEIAKSAETVDLSADGYFTEEFIRRMCFDES